jgi:2-dehydro-3-deoxyphosphogluconate aldolase/(4S)-4-hydroxy-2-oxoglutarate aldolase
MSDHARTIAAVMAAGPVIPVVLVDEARSAVPLARALLAGGITVIEVTLRTTAAIDAIRAIAAEVEDITVGAGTVLDPAQLDAARLAGARFAVSPGTSPRLLDAAAGHPLALLPGAASVSESMTLLERGYARQ